MHEIRLTELDTMGRRKRGPVVEKTADQRVHELRENLQLLREHAVRLFEQGAERYVLELLMRLRVLICKRPSNVPLLRDLMREHQVRYEWEQDAPGGTYQTNFEEFVNRDVIGSRNSQDEFRMFTYEELVWEWSSTNAAHVDPATPEDIHRAINYPVFLNGVRAPMHELCVLTSRTLIAGQRVIDKVDAAHNSRIGS